MRRPAVKVSVVIPHYNDLKALDLCLNDLMRQSFPAADREIIVADNASPQGEAEVIRLVAGRARVVTVREKGAGPARNGGAAAAQGEILAFVDADCRPGRGWLRPGSPLSRIAISPAGGWRS
jgi:glycosyltransferase involved in cell wall biosynthesis